MFSMLTRKSQKPSICLAAKAQQIFDLMFSIMAKWKSPFSIMAKWKSPFDTTDNTLKAIIADP